MPIYVGTDWIGQMYVGPDVSPSIPWTPSNLSTTPAFWLDATDSGSLTLSGTDVTTWGDISGNSRDFISVAASYATYNATGLNGMPAVVWPSSVNTIRYDTNNSFDVVEAAFIASWADGTPTTWSTSYPGLLTGGSDITIVGDTNTQDFLYFGATMYSGSRDGVVDDYTSAAMLPMDATFFVLHRPAGALNAIWQIGNDRSNGGRGWWGPIGEMVTTSTRWTTDERQKLEGYLAWKWGVEANLPVGHPYKNAAPTV